VTSHRPRSITVRKSLGVSLILALSMSAPAMAMVDGDVGQITHLYVYSDYGTGDVVIKVQSPLPGCAAGFWLRMTDVGAKYVYAKLLTAHETGASIRVSAYDGHLWGGSTGQYCRIYMIGSPG
jgi:hypothetical protein